MFERIISLIGEENFEKIAKAKVVVVGVGGVGSSCVEALVRSGIGNIKIIDFDSIDLTNLNRQLMTYQDNLGTLKVEALEKRIKKINPLCNVKYLATFLEEKDLANAFKEADFVFDCCDTLATKKAIIKYCLANHLNFITAMGTANKLDPLALEITELRKTTYDPLAKALRKWAKDERLKGKIYCCSSKEARIGKGRKLSSMIFVPASAGILMASFAIRRILDE